MIKTLLLVLAVSLLLQAKPNSAPYIHQAGRPLNIAHRGLCSILPENTLQAFSAALYQGADFIELDVVYTKEKQLLVMHDPFLTRITNIKSKPEFATRYNARSYNGESKTDWWTDEFTTAELKTLGIKQAQAPGRLTIFDYQFTFPLLSEVIEMVIEFNRQHKGKRNPDGRLAGILIEAKDSQMYRDLYGIEIGKDILDILKKYNIETIEKSKSVAPIYLHSFDYGTVKYWGLNTELPNNFLAFSGESLDLNDISVYATGIGFEENILWNYGSNNPTDTFYKARELGLVIHIWTFKDDVLFFNAPNFIVLLTRRRICTASATTRSDWTESSLSLRISTPPWPKSGRVQART
jgi:glycerophosphoryl diester phosphodiesterase